jgi:hypothetical protein
MVELNVLEYRSISGNRKYFFLSQRKPLDAHGIELRHSENANPLTTTACHVALRTTAICTRVPSTCRFCAIAGCDGRSIYMGSCMWRDLVFCTRIHPTPSMCHQVQQIATEVVRRLYGLTRRMRFPVYWKSRMFLFFTTSICYQAIRHCALNTHILVTVLHRSRIGLTRGCIFLAFGLNIA